MNLPARIEPTTPGGHWVDLVKPAADLAAQIARTDFVPEAMRNNPAQITACILYGDEIGLGPMQALAKIDVIKGRPSPKAELGRALALAHGHEVWTEEATNTRVTVGGKRKGSTHEHRVTWTMDDAKRAGIDGNPNYKKYPRQMLLARASAELVRQMCPDALGGITVFAEEVGAEVDGDTSEVAAAAPVEAKTTRSRARAAISAAPEAPAPPLPDEEPAPAATPAQVEAIPLPDDDLATELQIKKLVIAMNGANIRERADRLSTIVGVIGRDVASSKECTRVEAGMVLDALEAVADGKAEVRYVDGRIVIAAVEG